MTRKGFLPSHAFPSFFLILPCLHVLKPMLVKQTKKMASHPEIRAGGRLHNVINQEEACTRPFLQTSLPPPTSTRTTFALPPPTRPLQLLTSSPPPPTHTPMTGPPTPAPWARPPATLMPFSPAPRTRTPRKQRRIAPQRRVHHAPPRRVPEPCPEPGSSRSLSRRVSS